MRSGRITLKKVKGEANPADLFTKHSLTRERLQSLTRLFDCYFRDGRAASAPQLRQGKTSGVKIAEADFQGEICAISDANEWPLGVLDPASEEEGGEPCMPHVLYQDSVLDNVYPSLKAPQQLDLDDLQNDAWDAVCQRGLREAQSISEEMKLFG